MTYLRIAVNNIRRSMTHFIHQGSWRDKLGSGIGKNLAGKKMSGVTIEVGAPENRIVRS